MKARSTIIDLLEESMKQNSQSFSIIYGNKKVTYNDLNLNVIKVALFLKSLGIKADDVVGVLMEQSEELIFSIWGVLKSGAAYIPLSIEYPEERLLYMIKDSGTKVILTINKLQYKYAELLDPEIKIVSIEYILESIHEYELNLDTPDPSHLAYVIYTSGSSGKPKGVMIEHRGIMNQMTWLKEQFGFNNKTVIIQKTPISFDAAQWEILSSVFGGRIVINEEVSYNNPTKLIKTIIDNNVNVLQCVPTLLQALVDNDDFKNCRSLSLLLSGGEVLTKKLALMLFSTLSNCNLVNLYGPTECTINTSFYMVDKNDIEQISASIPIGYSINNLRYYILNKDRKLTKHNEIGELAISGIGLARGYINQEKLTYDKFINNPFSNNLNYNKLYLTGDLVSENNGCIQYVGRLDHQIKIRGYRVERGEIEQSILCHDWVKRAAVITVLNDNTKQDNIIAYIELNPREAILMDQGIHSQHHISKKSKLQVEFQLSNNNIRDCSNIDKVNILNLSCFTPTIDHEKLVFARKSYRFFNNTNLKMQDILGLFGKGKAVYKSINLDKLDCTDLGEILRYFGQFNGEERLLPKYGYASPGALYATQLYVEIHNICGLNAGYYYYHPRNHQLILIKPKKPYNDSIMKLHFIGKQSAIKPVYENNILEVLEMEVGHMLGLFDEILPKYGLMITKGVSNPKEKRNLKVQDEDFYLGTFCVNSFKEVRCKEALDIYVQVNNLEMINDVEPGMYKYTKNKLVKITNEIISKKHVIAINQGVYNRAAFGVILVAQKENYWQNYISLGRKLQSLQMNNKNIGLMSSGYSSKSGNNGLLMDRIKEIVNKKIDDFYFFLGGGITDEQISHRGMNEDIVHMRGPEEIIKDDLAKLLPFYMLPNSIIILPSIPLTSNGKIDYNGLKKINYTKFLNRKLIAPTNEIEKKIYKIWTEALNTVDISINDDFFEIGGNSLIAVTIINNVNKIFNIVLMFQTLFETRSIKNLAQLIVNKQDSAISRIVLLQDGCKKQPVFCWPGLGGYCMNLRLLANKMGKSYKFYGIQTHGINQNEYPYKTLTQIATEDIKLIKKIQPVGPYTLWGYSFGTRVAIETAYQLEQAGDEVNNLVLIAPGFPKIKGIQFEDNSAISYSNHIYLSILFSVFMGRVIGEDLVRCIDTVKSKNDFINFVIKESSKFDAELINKIIDVVECTYNLNYTYDQLSAIRLKTPVTIYRAEGDECSPIERHNNISLSYHSIINLPIDHYSVLKENGSELLSNLIKLNHKFLFSQMQCMRQSREEILLNNINNLSFCDKHINPQIYINS